MQRIIYELIYFHRALRTNHYTLTRRGRREIDARNDWDSHYIDRGLRNEAFSAVYCSLFSVSFRTCR